MEAIKPDPPVRAFGINSKILRETGRMFRVHYRRQNLDHELEGRYGVTVRTAMITRECRTTLEEPSRIVQLIGRGPAG